MSHRLHFIATLCLIVLFAAYGLEALTIPLFPGQENEPFKPRTMPFALATIGVVLAGIRAMQLSGASPELSDAHPGRLHWHPVIRLCLVMLAYGYLMPSLGFILATTLFLVAGFLILGERRRSILLFLPLVFSLVFFLLMTEGLGLYLSPGSLWGP